MIVFKVPFDLGGLGKSFGSRFAPEKILEFAKKISVDKNRNSFVIEEKDIFINDLNISESLKIIEKDISELPFVVLGGDHTITYSILKRIAKKNLGVVIFDAHPDLMQSFSVPTHENYLRHLIEENILSPEQIILVGIRSIDPEEKRFLQSKKIVYFDMHTIMQEGIQDICDSLMENMQCFENVYVSVDVDAVDPAFAPGTGNLEAGGLSSRELLYFLKRIVMMKNFSGGDIVEFNPEKDVSDLTARLCARILFEMCKF
jgi:agmatinase